MSIISDALELRGSAILKLFPWDIWAVAAIALAGVIFVAVFHEWSLLMVALIGLALCTYVAIRISLYDLN